MHTYKVFLKFTFDAHNLDYCLTYSTDAQMQTFIAEKYAETVEHFTVNSIESHVKRYDPKEFIQYCFIDSRVITARWIPDTFQMEVDVESDMEINEFYGYLMDVSLADGEYESTEDNGWTIKFINDNEHFFEYGVLTYQNNQPIIEELDESDNQL